MKKNYRDQSIGEEIYGLIKTLYPICRSITGNGVRETFEILKDKIPLEIIEVPTGTQVFDWVVPKEWNIKKAYIKNENGDLVVDFSKNNLHIVQYSTPIHRTLDLAELKKHLHTLPEHPDWIPYKTSYYDENWGFCLPHSLYMQLASGQYEVCIDSELKEGHLTYGELYVKGESDSEILIHTHVCHPSLCNDNLSGIAVVTYLANLLKDKRLYYSYRFVFVPGTIGAITWLKLNEKKFGKIKHGLVVCLVGDPGNLTYKKSRIDTAEVDKVVTYVLSQSMQKFNILEFSPYGYDERQYCSPGINLPVGRLTRSPNASYPQYHTSADDLDLIKPEYLQNSFETILEILNVMDTNRRYMNTSPNCEPQLGKRGLYKDMEGDKEMAMLWVLNRSDGQNTLLDIAIHSGLPFNLIHQVAMNLVDSGLLSQLE